MTLFSAIAIVLGMAVWYQPADDNATSANRSATDTRSLGVNPLGVGFQDASRVGIALASTEPFTIAVLGDSTGNERTEWVYLMAHTVAEKYGRPVTVHDWSLQQNNYSHKNVIGESGTNPPVVIWNGSASGRDAGYSIKRFETMAPERPDLVIVNHGHNHTTPKAAVQGIDNLLTVASTAWGAPAPAVAVVLQNPRTDKSAANQQKKVAALRADLSERPDVEVIDVWAAYEGTPDMKRLVRDDGYQPSQAGGALWATTTEASLGIPTTP